MAAVGRLLEGRRTRSGKVDFGLRLADKRTVANVGALALLVREQPTIRKALDVMAGYIFLHGESLLLNMKEQDGEVKLSLAFDVDRPVPYDKSVELGIGFLHRSLQQLFRERWKPQMVCFTHAAPQRKMLIEDSLWHSMFFSARISMESSVARLISMRLCRRQMQKWRGMRSNISTRLRRAAKSAADGERPRMHLYLCYPQDCARRTRLRRGLAWTVARCIGISRGRVRLFLR